MSVERAPIQVGIDYDGVFIEKAKSHDIFRRATKFALPSLPGVVEGVNFLRRQPDVNVFGVYTVRPEWLREGQTKRQVLKRDYPVERIVHTTNSPKDKIRQLLFASVGFDKVASSQTFDDSYLHERLQRRAERFGLKRIILIDDSTQKIVDATKQLYDEEPEIRPLLERFTHIAFNPKQPGQFEGLIIPGVIHVITMRNWSEIRKVTEQIRQI
ncbi:MAG: hypothetical protein ABH812_00985 [bacterium]